MAAPGKVAALRHLLAQRFPGVPGLIETLPDRARVLATGIPAIDSPFGGLPFGAATELVCAAQSCGGHLALGEVLSATRALRIRVAWIDATDCFDPASYPDDIFAHLVWVRCHTSAEAIQAADVVVRDANFGAAILDLRGAPEADLCRITATQWYRLQRAVEAADLAFVIETPRAAVPSAQLRFVLETSCRLETLPRERRAIVAELGATVQRHRIQAAG